MPRGKHRRHMRTYDDCFGASEAASWLHRYLAGNQNFGPGVTRQQTLQLLQKFLESHIIEPVRSAKCRVIQDDKQLYRFVAQSPAKTPPSRTPPAGLARGRTPLSSRENGALEGLAPVPTPGRPRGFTLMASDDQEEPGEEMAGGTLPRRNSAPQGALGRWEMHQLWASVTLARLRGLVGNVDDVLDGYRVSGEHIAHNMDRLSRNGVVILLDKTDDLPKWIINAMKCLIHWPRATGGGSCLPNYPGFEADVLKVISDFFCGLGTALLPPQLCRLFYFTFGSEAVGRRGRRRASPFSRRLHRESPAQHVRPRKPVRGGPGTSQGVGRAPPPARPRPRWELQRPPSQRQPGSESGGGMPAGLLAAAASTLQALPAPLAAICLQGVQERPAAALPRAREPGSGLANCSVRRPRGQPGSESGGGMPAGLLAAAASTLQALPAPPAAICLQGVQERPAAALPREREPGSVAGRLRRRVCECGG
ncbi:cell cycle control protein, putative [Ixodes scapularis]|uniref:Cell cycle control protein, putative n=1 Tax=Ixodes scapularis TaxID=6945 RepID=B7PDN7_IXOSC|nr:cell cycle control protein, putative [Ixodes scapularis]|eukprot:XP_002410981.1 cell cycle control protein, putative [Ixodes scapularis]